MSYIASKPNFLAESQKPPAYKFGTVLGRIELSESTVENSAKFAAQYFKDCEAESFSGEDVATFRLPYWAPQRSSWAPVAQLADLGYQLKYDNATCQYGRGEELVATIGVDPHIDDSYGPVLCLVLHNDGLKFKQAGVSHVPAGGDWFIFNDRALHSVKEAKGESVFVALTFPLVEL